MSHDIGAPWQFSVQSFRRPSPTVLVNNAAILYDDWQRAENANLETVREAFETNTLGAWRMCQAFIPLLGQSKHGRIVTVSSESGSLAIMGGGTPGYSVSKASLNALTRMLADELRPARILVNSVCPGWVATDMGGPNAPRTIEEGAASIMWAALLPDDGRLLPRWQTSTLVSFGSRLSFLSRYSANCRCW